MLCPYMVGLVWFGLVFLANCNKDVDVLTGDVRVVELSLHFGSVESELWFFSS